MRPRERRESGEQDLFRSRLDQIIAMSHPQVRLAKAINWRFLEERFGAVYTGGAGWTRRLDFNERTWKLARQRVRAASTAQKMLHFRSVDTALRQIPSTKSAQT